MLISGGSITISGGVNYTSYVPPEPPPGPSIISTGLVLYLDAGNPASYSGSGNTWVDLSSSAKNGTIVSATYSPSANGSLVFAAAAGAKVDILNANTLWLLKNNITAEIWYSSTNYQPQLLSTGVSNTGFNFGQFSLSPTKFKVTKYNVQDIYKGDIPQNNTWHQAVLTYSSALGAGTNVYVDGALSESLVTQRSNLNSGTRLTIGYAERGNHVGSIAIVRMYNKALSETEVLQNFNADKSRFGL